MFVKINQSIYSCLNTPAMLALSVWMASMTATVGLIMSTRNLTLGQKRSLSTMFFTRVNLKGMMGTAIVSESTPNMTEEENLEKLQLRLHFLWHTWALIGGRCPARRCS